MLFNLNVGQYQELSQIDEKLTIIEQNIYTVSIIKNITYEEASQMKMSEFNDLINEIQLIDFSKYDGKNVNNDIKLGGEDYHIEHNPDKLTSGQLLDIINIRANHDTEPIIVMDLMMAAMCRPKKGKYGDDDLTLAERAKLCRAVPLEDVYNVYVFFYNLWNDYLINSEDYLQEWMENTTTEARRLLAQDGDSSQ